MSSSLNIKLDIYSKIHISLNFELADLKLGSIDVKFCLLSESVLCVAVLSCEMSMTFNFPCPSN